MAERTKNVAHPMSPTSRRARRQETAKARQELWDNMTVGEKLEQKIAQGHEDSVEAEVLAMNLAKELVE